MITQEDINNIEQAIKEATAATMKGMPGFSCSMVLFTCHLLHKLAAILPADVKLSDEGSVIANSDIDGLQKEILDMMEQAEQ